MWASADGWNYADEVVYPFGYGLSYTTFTQKLDKVEETDGKLLATVTVTNTGDTAGKAVIELYAQTPYGDYEKTNLVEKSAIQLVAFDKNKAARPWCLRDPSAGSGQVLPDRLRQPRCQGLHPQ